MKRSFIPTAEQRAVIEEALRVGDLKVKAFAGAGKTSTPQLVAEHFGHRRGMYLAFNREIAASAARRFPPQVGARTMHSLAWASVSPSARNRMSLRGEPPHELAARFGLGPLEVRTVTGNAVEIALFEIGRMIVEGRDRFCRSADVQPAAQHIVVDDKIDEAVAAQPRAYLLPYIGRLWEEGAAARATSAISPDVLLKLLAFSELRIEADYILFDEAQDSDGVMLSVLGRQRHAQIIYLGDPYQQIYEWRGAINAMAQIDAPECALTESFRLATRSLRSRAVCSHCSVNARRSLDRAPSARSWWKTPRWRRRSAYSTQIEQQYHGKASRHSTRTRAEIPQQSERCGRGDAG